MVQRSDYLVPWRTIQKDRTRGREAQASTVWPLPRQFAQSIEGVYCADFAVEAFLFRVYHTDDQWLVMQLSTAEVEFSEWTPEGRIRHPSYISLRTDKLAASIIRETVPSQP